MLDTPVVPAGTPPFPSSPLVRAVIDSVSEGVVIFDQQGRVLYANAPARRVIDGQNGGGVGRGGGGDGRNQLQTLGARCRPLRTGTQSVGGGGILREAGARTDSGRGSHGTRRQRLVA